MTIRKACDFIPNQDIEWVLTQKPSVLKLWSHCWSSDKNGDVWMPLETDLSVTAFRKAKKALIREKLFVFERQLNGRKNRWMVKNLHGQKVKSFWGDTQLIHPSDEI